MTDDFERDCEGDGPDASVADVPPSLNAILDVLAHHYRRETLRCLVDDPEHVASIGDVASRLADRQTERTGKRPSRDQIEIELHHVHLPKLVEAGIVEYDARSQELRYWPNERVEDLLEYLEG